MVNIDYKLIGSVLLIVGTSIGAGMLALPIATAELGFLPSLVLLIVCWLVMLASAFLLLEVNLWLPQQSHLVSMAKATLGNGGAVVAWVVYLLLLYALLCAYIAGGSDFLHLLLQHTTLKIVPPWVSVFGFTILFGIVVCLGMRAIDYANRGLMLIKLSGYCLLVTLLFPFVSQIKLTTYHSWLNMGSAVALTVTMTSFGFAPIIPSLRVYFADQVDKLKLAILIGSAIPLICYIVWDVVIMGIVPTQGKQGLLAILHHNQSTSLLMERVTASTAAQPVILTIMGVFTPICLITSFLGVALCLADFLADGLSLPKRGASNLVIYGLTFLPPIGIVLFWPNIFIAALHYAGIYCMILIILLPTLMVWKGRSIYQSTAYRAPVGRWTLIALAGLAVAVTTINML